MAFQIPDKLEASRKVRQSFIPAPKVFANTAQSKTNSAVETQETNSHKTNTAVDEKLNTSKQFKCGDRVCISGQKHGTLLYFGKVHVSDGLWCGIELEVPEGSHNGKIDDVRYFTCKKFHGIFAPIDKVERAIPSKPLTTWAKVKESSVYDDRSNELQKEQSVTSTENHEVEYPVKRRSEVANVNFWRKPKTSQVQDQSLSEKHSLENQANLLETHPSLANKSHDNSDHHIPWQQFLKSHGSQNSYVQSQHIQNQSKSPSHSQLKTIPKECETSYTSGHSIPLHSSRTTGSPQQIQKNTTSSYSDQQQPYSRLSYQPQQQYSEQQFKSQQYQRNSIPHQYQQQHQQFTTPHSHHQSLHYSSQQQYDTSSLSPQQLYLHETQQPGHQYQGHHYSPQQQQYPPPQQQYTSPQQQQYLPQQQYPPPQQQQYPPPSQQQYPPTSQQPYASPPHQQQYPQPPPHQQQYIPPLSHQQQYPPPPAHHQQYTPPPHHQQQCSPHVQQQLYAPPPQHSSKLIDHNLSCLPEERTINEEKDNGSTQADMEISACVKEYLESDRRTYFNFTFDAENSSNVRTASNKPNSLTSSLYQAERELDPAGVIWELENTDDEISFRIDSEKTSESSSLATSTDEKQLTSKLESGSPLNSKLALTENKMAESEALLIKQLEEELASNIVERGTGSEKGSSEEDDIILTDNNKNKDKKNKLLINIEKAVESGINSLHGGHISHDMKSSLDSQFSDVTSDRTPPIMTDSGIMVDSRISDFGRYKCSSMENSLDIEHLHTSDQLAADLQAGHREKNRPTSLISTTSIDTGYADTESCIMASPLNTEDMKTLINTEEPEEIEGDSVKKSVSEPLESVLQFDPSKNICTNENASLVKIDECQRNEDDIVPENKKKELNLPEKGKEAETLEKIDVECESNVKVSAAKNANKISENRLEKRASSTEKSTKNAANKVKATRTKDSSSRFADRKAESAKPAAVPELPKVKRERPKSKWDTIMNKIENNKESIKLKTKSDVRSTIVSYVQQKPIPEPKPVKEAPKLTHIPQPDYSKVKSKLFSATASTSTKQKIPLKPSNKATNNLKSSRRNSSKSVASSTTSNADCLSEHASEGKLKNRKDAKFQNKSLGSKTSLQSGSISSLKGSNTAQSTTKSMNTKSTTAWTNDKNAINKTITKQSTSKKISSSQPPSSGKISVTNKDKKLPALKHSTHQVDQNKVNKTTRNKVPSLKSSQSDNKDVKKEITRLEGLCESRTKDLHTTKLQLKETLKGFDAMAVMVNYLAFDLDAFTNFSLKQKFDSMKKELTETKKELENLNEKQKSLTKEIEDINTAHEKDLALLTTNHNTTLLELKGKLNEKHMQELSRQAEKWQNDKEKFKQMVEEKNKDIDSEHQQELTSLRLRNLEEIRTLQRKHDDQMERLHQQHRDKLAEITNTFETIKMTLSNKVESLCEECDKLRKRASVCEENLEKEVDVRIHNALEVYHHLPQEIDSLKAVIDMKNTEIQNLNKENVNLRTQVAEIQPTLEKITLLRHKVENLEAILLIKTDHEKQLNEKCQSLMRKFNKENRANKRMSMEFDKLKWHMSQSELSGSQENILKMYNCSPSGSESGSPDPTQRFSRSPKHWDYDDTSGDQLSMSVSCDGANELKMRRRVETFLVADKISPQNSPKYKSNSVRMSQSWTTSDDQTDLFTSTQSTNTDTATTTHANSPSPAESTKPELVLEPEHATENSVTNTCPTKDSSST